MPRCKNCKELFKPKYFNQKYHLDKDECLKAMIQENREKETKRIIQKQKKEKSDWSKEKKERKEALMSHSEWLKLFQITFNTFIRERDKNENCISCQRPLKGRKFDAGHFRSVGSNPQLRFNEENVFGQCVPCNRDKHGNLLDYRKQLVIKLGVEKVEYLENFNKVTKLSIPEIKEKIQEYKQKIKDLKNGN